ncbi:MAG: hypothetical protein NC039_02965 [Muribaculaceae bacterium]|nr:hypothetical protein [Muribaculaceae bacterium]
MRFIQRSLTFLSLLSLLMPMACGDSKGYVIDCDFAGLGDHGIEMVTSDGRSVARHEIHPKDGRFKAEGESAEPSLVEFFTLDGRLLFTCAVSNGDRLEVSLNIDSVPATLSVKGHGPSELFARWIVDNDSLLTSGTDAEVNRLISRLVSENPTSTASTLMLVTRFRTRGNELLADSLLNLITTPARPMGLSGAFVASLSPQTSGDVSATLAGYTMYVSRDTTSTTSVSFSPLGHSYSLIAINGGRKPDSIRKRMRALYKDLPSRRFDLVETSVADDSLTWRSTISGDSARWKQGWISGGPASPRLARLAIPTVPFYILTDSLGTQLYRGTSLYEADTLVRRLLNHPLATNESEAGEEHTEEGAASAASKPAPVPNLGPGTLQIKKAE